MIAFFNARLLELFDLALIILDQLSETHRIKTQVLATRIKPHLEVPEYAL